MSDQQQKLVLVGGGEHARVVADVARSQGWILEGFVDPAPGAEAVEQIGAPCLGDDGSVGALTRDASLSFVLALGATVLSLARREELASALGAKGVRWARILHSWAWISPRARLGVGTVVCPGAIVNAGVQIGEHVIVNSGAVIEHDARISSHSHVGPGVVIGGGASIGRAVLLGLGARVRDHVPIGDRAVVGMGAVVVAAVAAGDTVLGLPARPRSGRGA